MLPFPSVSYLMQTHTLPTNDFFYESPVDLIIGGFNAQRHFAIIVFFVTAEIALILYSSYQHKNKVL